jgi:DNA-dependent RNA polymerase
MLVARSLQELGEALGASPTTDVQVEAVPDILDTQAATRERFWEGPFSTTPAGLEILKRVIPTLADNIRAALEVGSETAPPRGLEQPLRLLSEEDFAFMALRTLINQVYDARGLGPDRDEKRRKQKRKKKRENPARAFRQKLGRLLRDEMEFAGLFGAQAWVLAKGRPSKKKGITPKQAARAKHIALARAGSWGAEPGKFRRVDWKNADCTQAGDWLIAITHLKDLLVEDGRGGLELAPDVRAAFDELAEDLIFKHPLYRPSLVEPPPWTGWRTEYDDRISATFVKATHPETVEAVKAAFANDSFPHAMGVSAIQSVPLKINPVTLELVKEFAGPDYKRDTAIADELLVRGNRFWSPIRCDFRGRLIHLSDFNYTRSDPVRSLFMFADGKPIGDAINWLEIAVANSYGIKASDDRHKWVAEHREFIKAVVDDPRIIWLQYLDEKTGKPKATEPFQFAAACAEYVAADARGPDYETHLPIWMDATSNGLQHVALTCRDSELAAKVNLNTTCYADAWWITKDFRLGFSKWGSMASLSHWWALFSAPLAVYRDIYKILADNVATRLLADRAAMKTLKDLKEPLDVTTINWVLKLGSEPLSRFWLDHRSHLRDLLKQPVMTLCYGATKGGMLDQIKDAADDLSLKLPKGAAAKLRDIVWDSINEKLPGAMAFREHIRAIVSHCLEPGREWYLAPNGKRMSQFRAPPATFMSWVTPSGLPVSNRYLQSEETRVRLPFLGQTVKNADGYTDLVRSEKARNSGVANFVHSLDASHLILSVNTAVSARITNFMSVHDCFATLAPDTRLFAIIRRAELAKMYVDNPLDSLFERNVRPGADDISPLPMGDLNPYAVIFSELSDR